MSLDKLENRLGTLASETAFLDSVGCLCPFDLKSRLRTLVSEKLGSDLANE